MVLNLDYYKDDGIVGTSCIHAVQIFWKMLLSNK